ncbi:hypothetical protein GCM10010399_05970 [Dactylosporangium fulvum]|uniref:Uncharacterized protein n=1 Tax=Dactylosporangium fulvum TaxID=53359 RepID=A0ABY5VW87_9ACTN|nr:hypothetical protein [Dactylosporangium fulvum]UWP81440.1 hypothetical protein Dfulv_41030 [Dactylosporangium fulvum]
MRAEGQGQGLGQHRAVDEGADRKRVGQVAGDDDVSLARQGGAHLLGQFGRFAVVQRDPVACAAKAWATAVPIPREAPVTNTLRAAMPRSLSSMISAWRTLRCERDE